MRVVAATLFSLAVSLTLPLAACQRSGSDQPAAGSGSGSAGITKGRGSGSPLTLGARKIEPVTPPMDLKTPPADALKTPAGLTYKLVTANPTGTAIGRNDSLQINSTTWKQASGETVASNKARGQPLTAPLSAQPPAFDEMMQLLHKGETAMIWVPTNVAFRQQAQQAAEPMVYEIEIVDVTPAPPVPADVAAPPAKALTLKSGTKYEIVKPGTGTEKARAWDTVSFTYSAWDATGKMFESTETRKHGASAPPFKQAAPLEEVLTSLPAGTRVRFWVDGDKMKMGGRTPPNMPKGLVCYELEITQIQKAAHEPPPIPSDVAKPPADAKKTDKGVFYKILKHGPAGGAKPTPSDVVKVDYTGWTTDGRMFDSSQLRGKPAEFPLTGVIAGWTDGLQVLSPGDAARFWIPEELAYKGAPNRPQGMLVFDIELLETRPKTAAPQAPLQPQQPLQLVPSRAPKPTPAPTP